MFPLFPWCALLLFFSLKAIGASDFFGPCEGHSVATSRLYGMQSERGELPPTPEEFLELTSLIPPAKKLKVLSRLLPEMSRDAVRSRVIASLKKEEAQEGEEISDEMTPWSWTVKFGERYLTLLDFARSLKFDNHSYGEMVDILNETPLLVRAARERPFAVTTLAKVLRGAGPLEIAWDAPAPSGQQSRTIELVLRWLRLHERTFPVETDFGEERGQVGVPYPRTVHEDFPSRTHFLIGTYVKARRVGVPFRLSTIRSPDHTEMLRPYWQDEIADMIVDWIEDHHGRTPIKDDFGFDSPEEIPLYYTRFTGTIEYRNLDPGRYFDSTELAYLAVKRRAMQRGVFCAPFLGGHFTTKQHKELVRMERRTESQDRVLHWMIEKKKFPRDPDFGTGLGKVGLKAQRFFGTGTARPGYVDYPNRFHDSPEEAREQLILRAKARNLVELLPLLGG